MRAANTFSALCPSTTDDRSRYKIRSIRDLFGLSDDGSSRRLVWFIELIIMIRPLLFRFRWHSGEFNADVAALNGKIVQKWN